MDEERVYEWEIVVPTEDGVPVMPRFLDCPDCHKPVRRRAGNVYSCKCGYVIKLIKTNQ